LTSYFFPGQTLYHAALLVEGEGLRMFFVGDSHTMSGLDDYCAQNRNFLGRGVGFQYCLSLIEKLQPTHIFNVTSIRPSRSLPKKSVSCERRSMNGKTLWGLVPWEHANYATDESWVRCFRTRSVKRPWLTVDVVVSNHATWPTTACRGAAESWGGNGRTGFRPRPAKTRPLSLAISPRQVRPAVSLRSTTGTAVGTAAVCRSDCGCVSR
jgi:hypothetical protein